MNVCEIGTLKGRTDICDLQLKDIDPEDICRTLGNLCRFNGRGNRFFSVAQHSLLCEAIIVDDYGLYGTTDTRLGALCHDFAEAFIGDVIRPIKEQMPTIKELETRIEDRLTAAIPMGRIRSEVVKYTDMIAVRNEAEELGLDTSWWSFDAAVREYELKPMAKRILKLDMPPYDGGYLLHEMYLEVCRKLEEERERKENWS